MSPKTKSALKIAVIEFSRLPALMIAFYGLATVLAHMPWWASVVIWVAGMLVVLYWHHKTVVGGIGHLDGGIPLVMLFWPVITFLIFIPDVVEDMLAKLFGAKWDDEGKIFIP